MRKADDRRRIAGPLLVLGVLVASLVALRLIEFGGARPGPEAQREWKLPSTEGPTLVVSATTLDFGVIDVQRAVIRKVVVRNDGDQPVTATISVGSSGSFDVDTREIELAPGASRIVSVTASPAAPGILEDELRIALDASGERDIVIPLQGRVEDDVAALGDRSGGSASSLPVPGTTRAPGNAAAPAPASAGRPGETPSSTALRSGEPTAVATPSGGGSGERVRSYEDPSGGRGVDVAAQRERATALVLPYAPGASAPVVDLSERPAPVPDVISPEEAAQADPLPEQAPDLDDDDPSAQDPQDDGDDDLFDDDPFDDDDQAEDDAEEPEDAPSSPIFAISGSSTVTLLGKTVRFYPQQLGVLGGGLGGSLQIIEPIRFPIIPFAFGESMLLAQSGAVTGSFNLAAGQVDLMVPMAAVDSDGYSAPMMVNLTTGTIVGRTDEGAVVSLTGNARDPASGVLKLVGLHPIPVGFNNGAQQQLVAIEVLAILSFGTSNAEGA